jgi:hypothetical protein
MAKLKKPLHPFIPVFVIAVFLAIARHDHGHELDWQWWLMGGIIGSYLGFHYGRRMLLIEQACDPRYAKADEPVVAPDWER